jgi:uncharacterized membrane protein (UPF0182 family)
MPRRLFLVILAALVLLGLPAFAEFYTDWLWFREMGYEQIFIRSLTARSTITAVTGLIVFATLAGNLAVAFRALRPWQFTVVTPEGPRPITMDPTRFRPLVMIAAGLLGLFVGLYAGSRWDTWLSYLYATPFGTKDPILGYDVGFYVFTLPLLELVRSLLLVTIFVALAGSLAAYILGGEVGLDPIRGILASRSAVRHLSILAAAMLLVLAYGAWLQIPQMLTTGSGAVYGASYTDVHARIPALRVLVFAALVGSVLALWQMQTARYWPVAAAAALYVVVSMGGVAYAAIIQRFVVAPNEQVRETPYITHNIQATRAAFGLDRVAERALSGEAHLTRADIDRNAATIDNVPLWNERPLLDTFGQLQEIRTYYDFVAVDNDRYTIDGRYRQIMLSARELNSQSLPSRTWINEHLTFTHGYGLTLGPVNEVTREGLPVLFIRDLPPASMGDLKVTQPAVYYGELSNEHVFVKTKTQEFDFPRGEDNVFTSYAGEGGVPLSNVFRRLMFAIRFKSTDTFFSPNLTRESRVMIHRRIGERVRRIAPFFSYDPDPYMAVSQGRLVWIHDVYLTSNRYPYATSAGGLNYIRNAVKVTIDAYHGTTKFHLLDPKDPIAQTYAKIFPELLQPLDTMPEDLRTRLRYPHGIFSLQASMFATFHMQSPAVFYNREDQWEIPAFDVGGRAERMEPYYTIMKLPGETGPEYIQMLPFTPRQKDNLAAWMVARSDGANYGQLMVFQFPKQTVIFGPRQIAARISQDQVIAPQITLWNQQGSEVIQGTLLVIPIEESLIYIRPLYLRAAGGSIPELKRVIVAYQNTIVMEETLDAAIDRLFAGGGGARPQPPSLEAQPPRPAEPGRPAVDPNLAAQARAHYERAMQAQREGNWALYGDEIKKLGELLKKLADRPQQ